MNRPTPSDRSVDEEIRGWIAEAGDCRVETRPEHLERVRHVLLDHVVLPRPDVISLDEVEAAPLGVGLIRMFAVVVFVAAALFAAVYLSSRPTDGWARVAQTLQEQTWIHIRSFGPDGPVEESWISPRFEILARKHYRGAELLDAEFHDVARGIKDEYLAEENTIYRETDDNGLRKRQARMRQAQEIEVFQQLLHLDALKVSPLPDTEIVAERQREVIGQGKTWKLYELTFRRTFGKKSDIKMTIWVDPNTGLPRTWEIAVDGEIIGQMLDYPRTGRSDIRSLGVPTTAKSENHLPDESLDIVLSQVLTGLKTGRDRFDDYCGYVWNESVTPANLRRVWHKDHKWRVERALPRSTTRDAILTYDQVPIGIDLSGLLEREQELIFEPLAICDGQTVWIYHYKPKALVAGQPHTSERESVTVQPIYGVPDDLSTPWPDLMPEQLGHPNPDGLAHVWAYFIDPKPSDGPPGTLRLQVRESQFQNPNQPDRYRLWIDQEKNYLAIRSEISVFEPISHSNTTEIPTKLAYVDTRILTDLARSPNGFWYPTHVLRKTSHSKVDQVTRYLLDFHAEIPDKLFEPVK